MVESQQYFLLIMYHALIELRASDPDIEAPASKLADMLHNIPIAMCGDWSEEKAQSLFEQVEAKAKVHGFDKFLEQLDRGAKSYIATFKRLASEKDENPQCESS